MTQQNGKSEKNHLPHYAMYENRQMNERKMGKDKNHNGYELLRS